MKLVIHVNSKLQKIEHTTEIAKVVTAHHVVSIVHTLGISTLMVLALPEKRDISCGSGTLEDQVPVEIAVQAEQVVVTGVVKVIFELPQQSQLHQVIADKSQLPAQAQTISCKSVFVIVTVQAEIVLAVHLIEEDINILFIEEFQFIVKVPVQVILEANNIITVFEAQIEGIEKLFNELVTIAGNNKLVLLFDHQFNVILYQAGFIVQVVPVQVILLQDKSSHKVTVLDVLETAIVIVEMTKVFVVSVIFQFIIIWFVAVIDIQDENVRFQVIVICHGPAKVQANQVQ